MFCPKCGAENPDNSKICSNCSYVIEDLTSDQEKPKPKKSKLAFASAGLSGLAVALTIFLQPTIAFVFALLSISAAISSIIKIKKSERKLAGKSLAIAMVVFSTLHIVMLSYWRIDAPPIPNDYTIADLRCAQPQYAESYELLLKLLEEDESREDAPAIGLTANDVNTIRQVVKIVVQGDYAQISQAFKDQSDKIEQAWSNGEKGRKIITQLNQFPEIADLTEPNLVAEIDFISSLRNLSCLYQSYAFLQAEQGNSQIAFDAIIEIDNVFKKLSINARSTILRLVCYASLTAGIRSACFLINNANTPDELLISLKEHFQPLTEEQISLRNSIIHDYLAGKRMLRETFEIPAIQRKPAIRRKPMIKFNSTYRLLRNSCDDLIKADNGLKTSDAERLSVWPRIYPDILVSIGPDGKTPWFYTLYNPIGSVMAMILAPAHEKLLEIKTKLQIEDDLLQIVLAKRLGTPVSLKARAYGDEYIVDLENKKIYSPGPDGEPNTKDDIFLPINPDVLGWGN